MILLIKIIELILISAIVGNLIAWAFKPFQDIKRYLNLKKYYILNCSGCLSTWVSIIITPLVLKSMIDISFVICMSWFVGYIIDFYYKIEF